MLRGAFHCLCCIIYIKNGPLEITAANIVQPMTVVDFPSVFFIFVALRVMMATMMMLMNMIMTRTMTMTTMMASIG